MDDALFVGVLYIHSREIDRANASALDASQRAFVEALFALPFNDLLFQAQTVHRRYFDPNQVQVSTLLSIKTGACPEDCKYCPQSTRYDTGLETEKLMEVEKVLAEAVAALEQRIGQRKLDLSASDASALLALLALPTGSVQALTLDLARESDATP